MACVDWPFIAFCTLVLILVRCAIHVSNPTFSQAMMLLENFAWTLCVCVLTGVACVVTFTSVWGLGSLCCVFLGLLWVFVRMRRLYRKFHSNPFLILGKAGSCGKLWFQALSTATWTMGLAFTTCFGKAKVSRIDVENIVDQVIARSTAPDHSPHLHKTTTQAMRQNISHLSTIVRTPIRLMTSCFTTKGRTVKQQAAAMAAQRSVHTHKLRHQKRVTRRAHLRYSKASQKLRKALKAIQQLQESQRQLIQLSKQSAGTQQENQRLMRTLKTTAQNCQHARAKLADLQQSVGDHSALRIKNDQLMQQVSDLTASLKAAQEQITQSDICMGLAKSDIRALVSFNQDLQQSVQHYSSLNKQLQQQVNVSEARNSKLDAANQRLKVTLGSFCSRNFSLQRALTKKVSEADAAATDAKTENSRLQRDLTASQQETADVRQQLADAKALAGIAQAWSATLEAQLMASDGKVVDLTQQLSEDDPVKIVIKVDAGSNAKQQEAHDPSAREPNSKRKSLFHSPDAPVVDGIKAVRPNSAPPTHSWGSATPTLSLGSAPFTPSISPDKAMGTRHVSSASESASEASSDAGDAVVTSIEAGSIAAGTVTAIAAAGFALPNRQAVDGSAVETQTGAVDAAAMSLHADRMPTPSKAQAPASFAAPVKQHDCAGQSIALQGKVDLSEQLPADKTPTSDGLQQRLVGAEQQQSADKALDGNGMQQRLVISEHQQSADKTLTSDGLQQRLEMSEQQLAEQTLTSDSLQQRLVGAEQQVAAVTDANQGLRLQLDGMDAELAGLRSRCKIPRQDFDGFCKMGPALGKGANGEVKILHSHFLPGVVIKTSSNPEHIQHEAEVMSDIQHPNVVAAYGTMWGPVLADGSQEVYLAMEQMHHTLADRIKDCGKGLIRVKELVLCYAQIAAGLEAMHAKGIIHQDVRWDNMLGNESETVWKMCDLGSSARNKVHGKANVTAAEDCQRSTGAESPELAESLLNNGNYIPRLQQDMWALGLNMLDALGGSRPDKHTAFLTDTDYIAERAKGKRLPSYLQYLANLQSDPVPYAEQVTFPVPGQTIFLAPDEEEPFKMMLSLIKSCLSVDPLKRREGWVVARALYVTACRAGWLQ